MEIVKWTNAISIFSVKALEIMQVSDHRLLLKRKNAAKEGRFLVNHSTLLMMIKSFVFTSPTKD